MFIVTAIANCDPDRLEASNVLAFKVGSVCVSALWNSENRGETDRLSQGRLH